MTLRAARALAAATLTVGSSLPGCFRPPDLPTTPWEAPPLVSDADDAWRLCAPERNARVVCTVDGDTFDTLACGGANSGGERFRMLGIDAPETEKPGAPADCGGDDAARELARILPNRNVTLAFDRNCTDAFGRTLAYVWMDLGEARQVLDPRVVDDLRATSVFGFADDTGGEGAQAPRTLVMINEYLLRAGYARRFDEAWVEPLRWEAEIIAAERTAQVRKMGVWGACEN